MSTIEVVIEGRPRSYPGLTVRRALPVPQRRHVGPFVFLDHMGPVSFAPGDGIDVPPHPHIGLATVTYLFEGELLHRDTLGSAQVIAPGDVNWMSAGRGIAHSERTPAASRTGGARIHGLQAWVALPRESEESEPSFHHHPASSIPRVSSGGAALRVVAGRAYGAESPVAIRSPLFYVDARLDAGGELALPDEHAERAAHVVSGAIECEGRRFEAGTLVVFRAGVPARVRAASEATVALLGGEAPDGERHIWWNFVSSSKERIERAKADWKERRFPPVPGDDGHVPLP